MEASENSWTIRFYETISYNLARYQFKYVYLPGLIEHSYDDHDNIIKFLQKGQYLKAKNLLRKHIRSFITLMRDKIPKMEE